MSILGSILEDWKEYRNVHMPPVVPKPRRISPKEAKRIEENRLAKKMLQEKMEAKAKIILTDVCKRHKVSRDDVMRNFHKREVVAARNELSYLLRQEGWFYNQIGEWLGGKHHTSIIYSVKMHEKRKDNARENTKTKN